jgi:hypothetical protein
VLHSVYHHPRAEETVCGVVEHDGIPDGNPGRLLKADGLIELREVVPVVIVGQRKSVVHFFAGLPGRSREGGLHQN